MRAKRLWMIGLRFCRLMRQLAEFSARRGRRLRRKRQAKDSAAIVTTLDPGAAAMLLRHDSDEGQAEPRAARIRGSAMPAAREALEQRTGLHVRGGRDGPGLSPGSRKGLSLTALAGAEGACAVLVSAAGAVVLTAAAPVAPDAATPYQSCTPLWPWQAPFFVGPDEYLPSLHKPVDPAGALAWACA